MRHAVFVRIAVLPGILLMSTSLAAMPAAPLLTGNWGGFQVRVNLGEAGGRIDLDCASASIDTPVRPDGDGKFTVAGRLEAFTPGPDRRGDAAPVFTRVSFTGQVDGQTLYLTMQSAGSSTSRKFKLKRDVQVKIIRCA